MIDDIKLEISKMPLQDAWNLYKVMNDANTVDYTKIRFGVRINFDLDSLFNQSLYTVTRSKKNLIRIGNFWYKMHDFNTELNDRTKLIKSFLLANSNKLPLTTPRGISGGSTMTTGIFGEAHGG